MVTGISLTGRFPERYFPDKTIPQQDFSLTYIINDTNPIRLRNFSTQLNLCCHGTNCFCRHSASNCKCRTHARTHTHTRMQRQNCTSKGRRCTPTRHQSCMISNMTTGPGETNCWEKVLSGKRLSRKRPVEKTFRNPSELFTGNSHLIWMIRLPNTKFSQHKFQVRLHTYRKGSYPHLRVFFPFSECATHDNSCETASCRNRLQTINVKRHTHKPIPYSGLQH